MILDTLDHSGRYFSADSPFARGLDYLRAFDPATPDGKYPLDGDALFVVVMTYNTKARTETRLEGHRHYADIQVVVSGEELCEWAPMETLTVSEAYDSQRDTLFFADRKDVVTFALTPGAFAVFYPEDAHKPSCHLNGPANVRKVVVKVRL